MVKFTEIAMGGDELPVAIDPCVSHDPPRFYRLDGTPLRSRHEPRRRRTVLVARIPRRTHARPRGAGRPRAQAARSSARSGDSGDSDLDDPAPAPGWRWARTASGCSS